MRSILRRWLGLAVLVCAWSCGLRGADAPATARVLLVTGIDYPGHKWRETTPVLVEALTHDRRLVVDVLEDPYRLDATDLSPYRAVFLHFMNWEKPDPNDRAKENLRSFVDRGGGLVLIHFACGAFAGWPEFRNLAGRIYDRTNTHDPRGPFTVDLTELNHGITRGLTSFGVDDELYICLTGEKPVDVLATARSKVTRREHPMAFVHTYGRGRVLQTPLGHDVKALRSGRTLELIRRGTCWAAGVEPVVATLDDRAGANGGAGPEDGKMRVRRDGATGRWIVTDAGRPVLEYNYSTVEPGERLLSQIASNNLKYARARSDYVHPLYGLDGEVLTRDWPVDHPHHRGIYWAWPEVDFHGERGDLHALQRVFARPTGRCVGRGGSKFAEIEAENVWRWDDQEDIVREQTLVRAWRTGVEGRFIDFEFRFVALREEVAIARRETRHYGGLNIRLAPVSDQQIEFHTDPVGQEPRAAWARLGGRFAPEARGLGLAVFQHPANPDYPGDWIQFPDINWFQPCFPAAGTRYVLRKSEPLVLRFRLWIHPGHPTGSELAAQWLAYAEPPPGARGR